MLLLCIVSRDTVLLWQLIRWSVMNAVPMMVECHELSMIGMNQNFTETGSSCIRETFLILLAMIFFQILARILPVF